MVVLSLFSLCLFIQAIGSVCICYYDSSTWVQLYLMGWLFYCIMGANCCFSLIFLSLLKDYSTFSYMLGILYLVGCIVSTIVWHQRLLLAWSTFFTEYALVNQNTTPRNASISEAPLVEYERYKTIMGPLKMPPLSLIKISNSYFRPNTLPRIKRSRTCREEIKSEVSPVETGHRRSISNDNSPLPHAQDSDESEEAERKCHICSENECNGVLMECGHGGICSYCADNLMSSKGICHICRSKITCILKIKVEQNSVVDVVGIVYL